MSSRTQKALLMIRKGRAAFNNSTESNVKELHDKQVDLLQNIVPTSEIPQGSSNMIVTDGHSLETKENNKDSIIEKRSELLTDENESLPSQQLSTETVCSVIRLEFENIRKALTCSICLCTYRDAVTLSTCFHAYCRECITQSLQQCSSNKNKDKHKNSSTTSYCPECQVPCTRRSIMDASHLNVQVNAYKQSVRTFGLAPTKYTPAIGTLTQLVDSSSDEEDDDDEEDMDAVDGIPKQPQLQMKKKKKKESSQALIAAQQELLASKTFARVLRLKQQKAQQSSCGEDTGATNNGSIDFLKSKSGSICNDNLLLTEQEMIVAANEKVCNDAAVHQGSSSQSSTQQQPSLQHTTEVDLPTFSQMADAAQEQEFANNNIFSQNDDNNTDVGSVTDATDLFCSAIQSLPASQRTVCHAEKQDLQQVCPPFAIPENLHVSPIEQQLNKDLSESLKDQLSHAGSNSHLTTGKSMAANADAHVPKSISTSMTNTAVALLRKNRNSGVGKKGATFRSPVRAATSQQTKIGDETVRNDLSIDKAISSIIMKAPLEQHPILGSEMSAPILMYESTGTDVAVDMSKDALHASIFSTNDGNLVETSVYTSMTRKAGRYKFGKQGLRLHESTADITTSPIKPIAVNTISDFADPLSARFEQNEKQQHTHRSQVYEISSLKRNQVDDIVVENTVDEDMKGVCQASDDYQIPSPTKKLRSTSDVISCEETSFSSIKMSSHTCQEKLPTYRSTDKLNNNIHQKVVVTQSSPFKFKDASLSAKGKVASMIQALNAKKAADSIAVTSNVSVRLSGASPSSNVVSRRPNTDTLTPSGDHTNDPTHNPSSQRITKRHSISFASSPELHEDGIPSPLTPKRRYERAARRSSLNTTLNNESKIDNTSRKNFISVNENNSKRQSLTALRSIENSQLDNENKSSNIVSEKYKDRSSSYKATTFNDKTRDEASKHGLSSNVEKTLPVPTYILEKQRNTHDENKRFVDEDWKTNEQNENSLSAFTENELKSVKETVTSIKEYLSKREQTSSPQGLEESKPIVVGSIVDVEARTWPGVNKQGGVAKIEGISIDDAGGSITYDVRFVLDKRKEKNVDAVFVKLQMELDSEMNDENSSNKRLSEGSVRSRGSRRVSPTANSSSLINDSKNSFLPDDLRDELKKQGCDVDGKATKIVLDRLASKNNEKKDLAKESKTIVSPNLKQKVDAPDLQNVAKAQTKKQEMQLKAKKRQSDPSLSNNGATQKPSTKKRKSDELKSPMISEEQLAPDLGIVKLLPPRPSNQSPAKEIKQVGKKSKASGSNKQQATIPKAVISNNTRGRTELPLLPNSILCQQANTHYENVLRDAISKGSLTLVSSFLTADDETLLKELCKQSKSRKVKVTLSDEFKHQKTTLCVLPATLQPDGNLVANWRSLKAMQSCLDGVPMVCSSWLQVCRNSSNQFVLPESSLYVRSLPTKSHVASDAEYGVAKMACNKAQQQQQPITTIGDRYAPFRDCVVYLCGFSCKNEVDFSALARQGGANEVITKPPTALARLKAMNNNPGTSSGGGKFVVLCSDSNAILSDTFERELRIICCAAAVSSSAATLVSSGTNTGTTTGSTGACNVTVLVVNSFWLFDSISCSIALPPSSFKPQGNKALKELWKLCCKQRQCIQ